MLSIGDSLGEDLGLGLGDVLGTDPLVHVVQDAVGDTGLARPDSYDWPTHFAADLAATHAQVTVVLLGANDAQGFDVNGEPVEFGTAQWRSVYGQRIAEMIQVARAAGTRLIWVGLPIMGPAAAVTNADMAQLNSLYEAGTAAHPGVVWFPTWSMFSDPDGYYTQYVTGADGEEVVARDPDEVHFAPGGYDYLASAVTSEIETAFHVTLTPATSSSSSTTTTG